MSQGIKESRNHNFRFKVVVANDYNDAVRLTYEKNHPLVEFVPGSITEESTKKNIVNAIKKQTGRSTIDVVVGGPPCKGFSFENKMTRTMNNPMNHLITHYVEMIKRTKPAAFVMENVPGLISMQNGTVVKSLISTFQNLGYHNATTWLLNAADYGVPQARKRAFLVGSRSKIQLERPMVTHGNKSDVLKSPKLQEYVTTMDAIGDLPRIGRNNMSNTINYTCEPKNYFQKKIRNRSNNITNHVITINSPLVAERIKSVPPGGNWQDIPIKLMKVGGNYNKLNLAHSMIYKRLLKNQPSITITNFRKAMIIHPSQHRLLSVREAARIQTFPDHFEFMGGISNMQQQVSDAVPMQLAKKVGDVILLHLHDVIKFVPISHSATKR